MRLSTILTTTALACQASARWLAWTPDPAAMDLRGGNLARPTQASEIDDYQVWAPEPTQPPSKAIVDLLLHRRVTSDSSSASSNNTWENDQTCGWYSGISSKPYVCDSPLACTTTDGVVACATEGLEQFYTVCLNYDAVQSGKCTSVGVQTGCCQNSAQPACGTFIWTGAASRSMFKCFPTETIISMIDEPQYIIDSSISAASASSVSSASAASASAASKSSAEAASRSGNGLSTVISTTTATDGSTSTYTSVLGGDSSASASTSTGNGVGGGSGGSSTNTGAVAGGIVGGLSLLALLIALLIWYYLHKKNKGNKLSLSLCGGKKKKEKHMHNKTYNEKNITNNDKRAYDKSSYDNGAYKEEANAYGQRSRSITPPRSQVQNFHFHIEDDRYDTTPEPRPSQAAPSIQPPPSIAVAGVATAPSRREQRRQARQQRFQQQPEQESERDLEMEEMEQAREQQDFRTHRYHPSSGQRYQDARRTPTPPEVPRPPAPDLDFIGRGI
ncbi:hypothetical protein VM1G_06394 [Cytospora mali]|uniref:Carcinoembryonic antigen-related cell adhesion molecule 1 n=1 Tax=Cytospora mali TaxID=578113 RepID=A0A194W210_CYTMA|nr:hypothetical protein VM1G_06394 [Valsa mali]